jgi:hypothetical protein
MVDYKGLSELYLWDYHNYLWDRALIRAEFL